MVNEVSRWPKPIAESALLVLTPEAENLVSSFRKKYDPSTAAGMPAHVTILYPFKAPHEIDESVKDKIKAALESSKPFDYAIGAGKRFPGVLYLALQDEKPFQELTLSLWKSFRRRRHMRANIQMSPRI